jgi:cytochrome P450
VANAGVETMRWRPKVFWSLYQKSQGSLLRRVEARFSRASARRRAFGAVVGTCPFVHVGEAKLARDVLRETSVKAPLYHAFEAFSGRGIFTAEGKDWEEKRSDVLKSFNVVGLTSLRDRAVEESARVVHDIKGKLLQSLQRSGDILEVQMLPVLQRLALRVTFGYLTGVSLEEACKTFGQDPEWVENSYLEASTFLRQSIPARARSIWMISDVLYRFTPVGFREWMKIRVTRKVSSLALRAAKEDSPLGIIGSGKSHSKDGRVFVRIDRFPRGMLDEVTTLLFAGHDTQSATLSWCLLQLVDKLEIQEELRSSFNDRAMADALGLSWTGSKRWKDVDAEETSTPAWATSAFAPLLEAVLRETLRLHPAAPLVVRKLASDVKSKDAVIPKGCAVGVWLSSVHRDKDVWDCPEEFDPSRWLSQTARHVRAGSASSFTEDEDDAQGSPSSRATSDRASTRPNGALRHKGVGYMPFAYGPRSCVGQQLAQVTMRIALAHLIESFVFTPSDDADARAPSVGFTVTPTTGAPVRVRLAK